ncbi:MAG: MauE/DoxX family redox-associated membrane protein [Pyrinomonadaceae bacterium]
MSNEGVGATMHKQASDEFAAMPRRRVPVSVLKWLVQLSRFALAALFLFTAGAKLAIVQAFAANVAELVSAMGFDYRRWMWLGTIAVIAAELITAALLLIPRTVRIGALCAAALLLGFAGFALYYVYVLNGEPLECGCFGGIIGSQLGVKTALRNLALLIPAILVFFGYHRWRTQTAVVAERNFAQGPSVNEQN